MDESASTTEPDPRPEPLHPPLYAGLVSELDVDPHFTVFTRKAVTA